jgi:hypothetical protein
MYDEPWQQHFQYDEPRYPSLDEHDRIVHLVHLDGVLVDAWSEPVETTRYAPIAHRIDRERAPIPVPEPPRPPAHELLTSWLQGLVGGAEGLAALDTASLVSLDPIDLEPLSLGVRHRLEGVLTLLRGVPQLDTEFRAALGNAVRLVHEADPVMLGSFTSAGQAAAGVVWAVGKANGHISPEGPVRQKDLAAALGVPVSLSGPGRRISTVLVGAPGLLGSRPYGLGCPDLVSLGTPALLTSSTRRLLVRLRDQAIRARDAQAA